MRWLGGLQPGSMTHFILVHSRENGKNSRIIMTDKLHVGFGPFHIFSKSNYTWDHPLRTMLVKTGMKWDMAIDLTWPWACQVYGSRCFNHWTCLSCSIPTHAVTSSAHPRFVTPLIEHSRMSEVLCSFIQQPAIRAHPVPDCSPCLPK